MPRLRKLFRVSRQRGDSFKQLQPPNDLVFEGSQERKYLLQYPRTTYRGKGHISSRPYARTCVYIAHLRQLLGFVDVDERYPSST